MSERIGKTIAIAAVALATVAMGISLAALNRSGDEVRQGAVLVQRIAGLLGERDRVLAEIAQQPGWVSERGCLENYLMLIRADGAAPHAPMRRRIAQLAANQISILALAEAYEPMARGPAFAGSLRELRAHVLAWNDRWNSLFEVFMAGGNLPAEQTPFPKSFVDAIGAEGAVLD